MDPVAKSSLSPQVEGLIVIAINNCQPDITALVNLCLELHERVKGEDGPMTDRIGLVFRNKVQAIAANRFRTDDQVGQTLIKQGISFAEHAYMVLLAYLFGKALTEEEARAVMVNIHDV